MIIEEIELDDAAAEEELLGWWERARKLAEERAHASTSLYVLARGHYLAMFSFPLPGTWRLLRTSRLWVELEAARPAARVTARAGRTWFSDGNPRTLSTAALRHWLDSRAAGQLDFVLVDTRARDVFAAEHIPGAINLPLDQLDRAAAEAAIGIDPERPIVVYCGSYG